MRTACRAAIAILLLLPAVANGQVVERAPRALPRAHLPGHQDAEQDESAFPLLLGPSAPAAQTAEFVAPPAAPEEIVALPPEPGSPGFYTLADLEAMALGSNPTLLAAAARIQAASGEALQAGLCPNPRIGYMGDEIGNEGRAGMQGAFIEQEFVRGNKLGLSRAAARQQVRRGQAQLEAQRLRGLTDVRLGFFEFLAAQLTLDETRELVRIGEDGRETVDALLRGKEVARADLLQAQVEAQS